jgi:hypothetical protein
MSKTSFAFVVALGSIALAACGGGSSHPIDSGVADAPTAVDAPSGPPDSRPVDAHPIDAAPPVDAMPANTSCHGMPAPPMTVGGATTLTVTGTVAHVGAGGMTPVAGATVEAHTRSPDTIVAMTTSAADGTYTLMVPAPGGVSVDGYLRVTAATYMPTNLYPSDPLFQNMSTNVVVFQTSDFSLLSAILMLPMQDTTNKGMIGTVVVDCAQNPVSGATVAVTPPSAMDSMVYFSGGIPSTSATATDTNGIAFDLNADPGAKAVDAMAGGITYKATNVQVTAGEITFTNVRP